MVQREISTAGQRHSMSSCHNVLKLANCASGAKGESTCARNECGHQCLMDFKYGILCQYMITFLAYRPSFMSIILTMFRVTCISRRRSRYHITEGIDGRLRYGSEPQWEYVVFRLVTTPAVGFICGTLLWYVCSPRHLDRSETTFSNVG
jgi:hypothetical protein